MIPLYQDREATQKEVDHAAVQTILEFPDLIDYYIKYKEDRGPDASKDSARKVRDSERIFISQIEALQRILKDRTPFYETAGSTYDEAHARLAYLKDVVENKGGHRIFYDGNKPIHREHDLHVMYRLVWMGTPSDVSAEVNDGRGPADYKISRGVRDKTIIEMKLAKNTQLARNLEKQVRIYQNASDAEHSIKAIIFFTAAEQRRVAGILKKLKLEEHKDIVLIDARRDNKPSGSKA